MSEQLQPLDPRDLFRAADPASMAFASTEDLAPAEPMSGQARARDAIALGMQMRAAGFHLYVTGLPGSGMRDAVKHALCEAPQARQARRDWVYLHNFEDSSKPAAVDLPMGRAVLLRDEMRDLIKDLRVALPAAFEREDYQKRRSAIEDAFRDRQMEALKALGEQAEKEGVALVRTPMGFSLVPVHDGKIVPPEEFNGLPDAEKDAIQEKIARLEKDLEQVLRRIPGWEKELRDQLRELNRQTAKSAVGQTVEEIEERFRDIPAIGAHLARVREDLIENAAMFIVGGPNEQQADPTDHAVGSLYDRYEVNVLVTSTPDDAACPIVDEMHPTLVNLVGRVEYAARQGVLMTNFRLIKPGALHRANGGYLVMDARALLTEPMSWQALKRALRQKEVTIEDVAHYLGMTSTVSLEPDPIPLDVTVILVGDRQLYYLLAAFDPEFHEHFKILADFDDDLPRSSESEATFARMIADMLRADRLKPMDRTGVARLVEHASRLADAADKLTLVTDDIRDVLIEADFRGSRAGHAILTAEDVEQTLAERERRAARMRERSHESILRDIALIETQGSRVGQINGLSVYELGKFRFGRPTRITARVRPGAGRVVDIEREVELGGPIHSKGVLILSGFLSGRYALDTQMSLFASLVFEQSYGGVEGDSASSAELYALLSALSEFPLRQDLAVTGSVNQHGQIQAIGGVNEKIEGYFDICNTRGLTGAQGVLIPRSNIQHLMLRADVVKACAEGRFSVYAAATVDEGIALLTGKPAGERCEDGRFPEASVNRAVEDRLHAFSAIRQKFGEEGKPDERNGATASKSKPN